MMSDRTYCECVPDHLTVQEFKASLAVRVALCIDEPHGQDTLQHSPVPIAHRMNNVLVRCAPRVQSLS